MYAYTLHVQLWSVLIRRVISLSVWADQKPLSLTLYIVWLPLYMQTHFWGSQTDTLPHYAPDENLFEIINENYS